MVEIDTIGRVSSTNALSPPRGIRTNIEVHGGFDLLSLFWRHDDYFWLLICCKERFRNDKTINRMAKLKRILMMACLVPGLLKGSLARIKTSQGMDEQCAAPTDSSDAFTGGIKTLVGRC